MESDNIGDYFEHEINVRYYVMECCRAILISFLCDKKSNNSNESAASE